jgi:hypothetical protein
MNPKVLITIAVVVLLSIIGFNYYSGASTEKKIAEMQASTQIMRDQLKQKEFEKEQQAEIQAMPESAQQILQEKSGEVPEFEISDVNFEKEDRAKLDDIMNRWNDNSVVASRTSRIALAPVVKDMQALRREANDLRVTPCLTKAQANMLAGMDSELNAYLDFMADSKAELTKDFIGKYEAHAKYYEIIVKCTK